MTDHDRPDPFSSGAPGARPHAPAHDAYFRHVADALCAHASELGRAWALRGAGSVEAAVDTGPTADAQGDGAAELLVRTLAEATLGGHWHEHVMRTGWSIGTRAFWSRTSLYQLLKELDGGLTLLLSAADAATRDYQGDASAADGLAMARRLSDAASLLRLAAAGGYTRAMSDELRQRYRSIRHDLRNPLGTITSAVALMEDETVPEATRADPRMRAMVARNARSMESLIAAALGDAAAQVPVVAIQSTSLRDLACAVRGDLRAAADGVNVIVADDLPSFPLDSAGLELLLKAIVIAIARAADGAVDVAIGLERLGARHVALSVCAQDGRASVRAEDLAFARELVARLGGRLILRDGGRVTIDIPVEASPAGRAGDRAVEHPGAPSRADRSGGNARDDVAGAGERADEEAGRL